MESWSPTPTPHRPTEVNQLDDAAEVTCGRGCGQVLDVIACWTTPSSSLSCDPGDVLRGGPPVLLSAFMFLREGMVEEEAAQMSVIFTSSSSAVLREKGKLWYLKSLLNV